MLATTRKYEIFTGIIVLSLSLGLVLVGELALRAIQWLEFGVQDSVETSSAYYIDSITGLRLNKPDLMLGKIRINNLGFRGPDLLTQKPKNTLRLAFLGSSTTYDAYSPEGRNWPHMTALNLGARLRDCKVDFINGGKPGYGMAQMSTLFRQFISTTSPDIVLILPSGPNSELEKLAAQQGLDTDHAHYQSRFYAHSLLLQKLEKNFHIIKLQRSASIREGKLTITPSDVRDLTERYRDSLYKLVAAVSSDTPMVGLIANSSQLRSEMSMDELTRAGNSQLFFMPYIYLPDVITLREADNAALHEVATAHDALVIGGENDIPATAEYYQDSVHFTPAGSAVMAERVVRHLLASPKMRELARANGCSVDDLHENQG